MLPLSLTQMKILLLDVNKVRKVKVKCRKEA